MTAPGDFMGAQVDFPARSVCLQSFGRAAGNILHESQSRRGADSLQDRCPETSVELQPDLFSTALQHIGHPDETVAAAATTTIVNLFGEPEIAQAR